MLFLRDQKQSITEKEYLEVLQNYSDKLRLKLKRTKEEKSIYIFNLYINHINKFLMSEVCFTNIDSILTQSKNLFSALVVKRKSIVANYLEKLEKIHEQLSKNDYFEKKNHSINTPLIQDHKSE